MVGLAVLVCIVFATPALGGFDSKRLSTPGDAAGAQFEIGWHIHALFHGQSPWIANTVFAPAGLNMATMATMTTVSLLVSPITLLFGTTAAYNVALLLAVWSAAVAVYLLARELFRSVTGAAIAATLMVVSPYEVLHGVGGHMNLIWTAGLPFVAFLSARYLHGKLRRRWLILGTGLVVAFTIGSASELFVTQTLFGGIALVIVYVVATPDVRRQLRGLALLLAAGGLAGLMLASPALYATLTAGLPGTTSNPPGAYPSDVTNVFVPSGLVWGADTFAAVRNTWLGNGIENTAYLPLTMLAALVASVALWPRSRTVRALLSFIVVALVLSFGPFLTVSGKQTIDGPEAILTRLPVTKFALPGRFSDEVFIGVVLLLAYLWSRYSGDLRTRRSAVKGVAVIGAAVAAFAMLYPNLSTLPYPINTVAPAYVSSGELAREHGGENILVLPTPGQFGPGLIWEADTHFAFKMPTGPCCGAGPMPALSDPTAAALQNVPSNYDWVHELPPYLKRVGVSTVLIDGNDQTWLAVMNKIYPSRGRLIGGVWVFDVR